MYACDVMTIPSCLAGLPGLTYTNWYGLFAPRGTPKDIVAKLSAAAMEALADPATGVTDRSVHGTAVR